MNPSTIIRENIQSIRNYTRQHSELMRAHHFLYDKRYSNASNVQFVVLGINPGESLADRDVWPDEKETPTEETSEFDFHKDNPNISSPSAATWKTNCKNILGTLDVSLSEVFFWSSHDLLELKQRYGKLAMSPHLKFCAELNKQLIEMHQPNAVIVVGINKKHTDLIGRLYNLQHCESVVASKRRLIERYSDGERPWIFTKHWIGARPSRDEKDQMRDYIAGFARAKI